MLCILGKYGPKERKYRYLDKIDISAKSIIRKKNGHYIMIKGTIDMKYVKFKII